MNPLISVLIPCYNHQMYLADCLDSLISQSYENIEVLIVDDASEDDSWKIIENYRQRLNDRFVDVYLEVNKKNSGVSATLNKMIRKAKGSIIKILASDDFLDADYFETIYRLFDNNDVGVVFSNAYIVDEKSSLNNPLIKRIFYDNNPLIDKKNRRLFERIFKGNIICAPSVALKKSLFDNYGLFDENLIAEDLDYWLNITKTDSVVFRYCDKPLVYYRQNSNSMTSRMDNADKEKRIVRMFDNSMMTRKKYKEYISGYKYNVLMTRLLLSNYKVSLVNNLHVLRAKCVEYKALIEYPYRFLLFWVR